MIKVKLLQEERKLLNFGRAIPRGKKIVDGIWVKVEIVGSNSNCDLESQLGFQVEEGKFNLGFLGMEEKLFLGVEGKPIHVEEVLYSLF